MKLAIVFVVFFIFQTNTVQSAALFDRIIAVEHGVANIVNGIDLIVSGIESVAANIGTIKKPKNPFNDSTALRPMEMITTPKQAESVTTTSPGEENVVNSSKDEFMSLSPYSETLLVD